MKRLLTMMLGLMMICAVFGSDSSSNPENRDGSGGTNVIKKVAKRLNDTDDMASFTMPERQKVLKNIVDHFPSARRTQAAQVERYTRDLLTCVDWLTSCDFGNRQMENAICQQMVLDGLRYADKLPLERGEFHLVSQIRLGPSINIDAEGNRVTGREWQVLRRQLLEHRLHLWRRIERTIDPDWNPDNVPVMSVVPPGGEGPAGVPPEAIEDPEVRKKYRVALKANRRKAARYHKQNTHRKLRDRYLPRLKKAITGLYSLQPLSANDFEVLEAYLRIYVGDEKLRSELFQIARKAAKGE